jgi:hypothetical protein
VCGEVREEMRRVVIVICFLAVFGCGEGVARACTCIEGEVESVSDDNRSRTWFYSEFRGALFTGRVTRIERERAGSGSPREELFKVAFAVERYWKGVTGAEAVIYTGLNGAACGVRYTEGELHLVYAQETAGLLRTSWCSAPKYSQLGDFVEWLGPGKEPEARRGGAKNDD